jgi:acylphosphatase
MKTVKVFISGIVQDVSFRAFVKEHADNLGVYGYVKNLDDGRVEAVFEGYDNEVNKMLELCKRGPPGSRIKEVEIEKIPNQGLDEFRIIRF